MRDEGLRVEAQDLSDRGGVLALCALQEEKRLLVPGSGRGEGGLRLCGAGLGRT